jgi:hypothetical protein
VAADLGHCLADRGAPTQQIDLAKAHGSHLAETDARVGKEEDDRPKLTGRVRQSLDLIVRQIALVGAPHARQRNILGRLRASRPERRGTMWA